MADNPLAAWLRGPERWAQAGAPDPAGAGWADGQQTQASPEQAGAPGPAGAGWADGQQTQASPDQAAPVAVGALLTATTTPGRAADFDEAPRRARRWGLVALAVVPWAAVAALALGARGGGGPPPAPRPAVASPGVDGPSVSPPSTPSAGLESVGALTPASPTPGRVAAAGALAVRRALTGPTAVGDTPVAGTPTTRYVDLAVPEAVEQVGDMAVVTVAALVLDGVDGRWVAARAARYAVPVRVDDAVPLAAPWPLPAPPEDVDQPAWTPATGADATAAAEAVAAAGYRSLGDLRLARDPALPGVLAAQVVAVAPGETRPRSHELWLRDQPVPAVLGLEPAAPRP